MSHSAVLMPPNLTLYPDSLQQSLAELWGYTSSRLLTRGIIRKGLLNDLTFMASQRNGAADRSLHLEYEMYLFGCIMTDLSSQRSCCRVLGQLVTVIQASSCVLKPQQGQP